MVLLEVSGKDRTQNSVSIFSVSRLNSIFSLCSHKKAMVKKSPHRFVFLEMNYHKELPFPYALDKTLSPFYLPTSRTFHMVLLLTRDTLNTDLSSFAHTC